MKTSFTINHRVRWPRLGVAMLRAGFPCLRKAMGMPPKLRSALTLIEVVASTMIVGLMAVAALNALGAATKSSNSIGNRAVAAGMADELMSEIVMQSYSDP